MTCSLIITTYNWKEALELVIISALNQSELPNEIIIADDGSNEDTKQLIENFAVNSSIPIIHSWQEDDGFRAAKSRNKAISKAQSEYIVLIDGDIILHKDFIKEHKINAKENFFIQGSRVLINEQKSKEVLADKQTIFTFWDNGLQNRKNAIHCDILSFIFSNKKDNLKGIKTCNMSFYKADCLKVNGFNEDFIGWGREDSEFVVRLLNTGVHRQNIRFNCIIYHIWHNENTRDSLKVNDEMLNNAINNKVQWCDNGIDKYR
ncbi:MAG: glycosyltransferase family 2 protein [Arcobacteraceae bacterium]|nr:glycosyltransferase family 2 protein [Arcobacteraceae bacterium]